MNVRLLRQVRKHIAEEGLRWSWSFIRTNSAVSPCGTQACIGGWTCILGQKLDLSKVETKDIWRKVNRQVARKLLALTANQARRLFYDWPARFNPMHSKDALRRIDHFIKTKGAE